jgi:GTPase SAR1 family protein
VSFKSVPAVIGNKSDIKDKRQVTKEEAENYSTSNGFERYFETSAKKNINIEEIFLFIGNHYIQKISKTDNLLNSKSNIKLTSNRKILNTRCNCK